MVNTTTTATDSNYYYKFYYKYDDKEIEYTFSADATIDKVRTNIKHFLKACSWTDSQAELIIPTDEEEY